MSVEEFEQHVEETIREMQEGRDMGICICIADSLRCKAETNTPL